MFLHRAPKSVSSAIRTTLQPARLSSSAPCQSARRYTSGRSSFVCSNGWLVPMSILATTVGFATYCQQDKKNWAFAEAASTPLAAFDPNEFRSFKLEKIVPITHNTKMFRFKLPTDEHVAGLHVASCVLTRYPYKKEDGSTDYVIRPYTPTSREETRGFVEFVIKYYPQGKMSKHIHQLKPGDELEIKGPIPKYNWEQGRVENVGMIAGGTGITPMLQLIRKIFSEKSIDTKTKVTLIFANQTEEDILLRDELEGYAKDYPDRFKLVYALDRPPKGWTGHTGFVTKELVKQHMPGPNTPSTVIFVCGPNSMQALLAGPKAPDMSQGELTGILKELGYSPKEVYKF